MLVLDAKRMRELMSMPKLIECLREAFAKDFAVPARQVLPVPGGEERLFLGMPAFNSDGGGAVKLSMVFPDNALRGLPSIQSTIVVFSNTGAATAWVDATTLTYYRTAAASALASTYLSRRDATRLVVIGTGALAPFMALAHCEVRPIKSVLVCGRSPDRAIATATRIRALLGNSVEVGVASSTAEAVASADVVSCATNSATPVLQGAWLKPGAFVDLVGSFSPVKREADDAVIRRARIFVDTFEGVLSEAGDLLDPIARGVIKRSHMEGELKDLVRGTATGRVWDDEIILFKSVGTALEDLAAVQLMVAMARSKE
jgi:ornithine cyclodeaminase/alanine dehydrogenase-like protein (mu-crystallin family)